MTPALDHVAADDLGRLFAAETPGGGFGDLGMEEVGLPQPPEVLVSPIFAKRRVHMERVGGYTNGMG
jgi:hypothetical protein